MISTLRKILKSNRVDGTSHTHVSLMNPKGSFQFNRQTTEEFWNVYCEYIETEQEYNLGIAEKPQVYMPILVDIDLKIETTDIYVLYNEEQVKQIIKLYQTALNEIIDNLKPEELTCVFLAKEPYQQVKKDKTYLKHGFHLHFPYIFMHKDSQKSYLLPRVKKSITELKLFESIGFEDSGKVVDDGYCNAPWLIYGGRKDGDQHKPYLVKNIFDFKLDKISFEDAFKNYFIYDNREHKIDIVGNVKHYLPRILSIVPWNRGIKEIKSKLECEVKKLRIKRSQATLLKIKVDDSQAEDELEEEINPEDEETEKTVRYIMLHIADYHAMEYNDWMRCGWALHKIFKGNDIGISIWKEFSSKSEKYDDIECECLWEKMIDRTCGIYMLDKWARTDSPNTYKSILNKKKFAGGFDFEKLKDCIYEEPDTLPINGFQDIVYSDLFKNYNTLFVKANMGAGKTQGISECLKKHKRVLFVTCKKSLAYDTLNKFSSIGFELYEDLEGTINLETHNKVICQIDSIHRIIGMCDLFIVDEFVDLTNQLLKSEKRTDSISAFIDYLSGSNKKLIMDANLDRVDYFSTLGLLDKSLYIKDFKKYHTDKTITFKSNEGFIRRGIIEEKGRIFVCSDTRTFVVEMYNEYIKKYPERKALLLTKDSNKNDKRKDYGEYHAIFVSPTVTAGVSHTEKIDKVFAVYTKRTITAWSATQQMLRCRNWKKADVYLGVGDHDPNLPPITDDEVAQFIYNQWTHEIEDFQGFKINRLCNTFEKSFAYYLYHEDFKRKMRSRRFFAFYFKVIMKRHGITIKIDADKPTKEDIKEFTELKDKLKEMSEDRKIEFYKTIAEVEPTTEEIQKYQNNDFETLPSEVYEYLHLQSTYGMVKKDIIWIKKMIDSNMKRNYKNLESFNEPKEQKQLDVNTINIRDLKDEKNKRKVIMCKMILSSAGYDGDIRIIPEGQYKFLPSDFKDKIIERVEDIKTVFEMYKPVDLSEDRNLMNFVNQKLNTVFGVKLISKKFKVEGKHILKYTLEFNHNWSRNPDDTSEPCIYELQQMKRLLIAP